MACAAEVLRTALQVAREVASRSRAGDFLFKKLTTTTTRLSQALDQERRAAVACMDDPGTARRIAELERQRL